jgi:hypothetical protein
MDRERHQRILERLRRAESRVSARFEAGGVEFEVSGIEQWHTAEYVAELERVFAEAALPALKALESEYGVKIGRLHAEIS